MKETNSLNNFIQALIEIDNEIYKTIKEKIKKNKQLTRYEIEYITFYTNKIREYKKKRGIINGNRDTPNRNDKSNKI